LKIINIEVIKDIKTKSNNGKNVFIKPVTIYELNKLLSETIIKKSNRYLVIKKYIKYLKIPLYFL
tara:strand:- start:114 stop:308 length:195 start_codon:yes stop_codon:yes gene_type:complete